MDAAPRTSRMFPSYSLAELEAWVAAGTSPKLDAIKGEVAARKAGTSTHYKVPQIHGGKVVVTIGRM